MSGEPLPTSRRAALVSALVLLGLLLASLSPLVPRAAATAFPGNTDALGNPGQRIREMSSAVPIFGFSMTASSGNLERLMSVTVSFAGSNWDGGDNLDLRALAADPRNSGVGLWRDDGTQDDVLDASDTPIVMAVAPMWQNGNTDVRFDFTAGSGTSEFLPTSVNGRYQWIVALRTYDSGLLLDGETLTATIKANAIVATSGLGTVSQPATPVNANPLTVDITEGYDIVGASGFPWVGPSSALVMTKAVLGLHAVDGGIGTNRGIQDTITSLDLRLVQLAGAISSGDFQPIGTNPATSGLALYRDDGSLDDRWDASDTGIVPASITPTTFPAGTTIFTFTFAAPGIDLPDAPAGNFDFFFVVRTKGIATGDAFRLEIPAQAIHVRGILPAGVDTDLRVPRGLEASGAVLGDATPPQTTGEVWVPVGNYLFALGRDLHFGHAMPSTQTAYAAGYAYDGESGLANATYSNEPSLASSPPVQALAPSGWQLFYGGYGFNATSLGTDSPADVIIRDRVGNRISTTQEGRPYRYLYETAMILILPDPGWSTSGTTPPFWIDGATGKLWFSGNLYNPETITLDLQVASLSGAELVNVSASREATLGGPTPETTTFPAGTFHSAWSTTYGINSTATGADAPVTITASDNLGNMGSATFDYGLDANGPSITPLDPAPRSTVRGNIVARASVADDHTGVLSVAFLVGGRSYFGLFDGTNYYAAISTADFPDGPYRITVQAWDMVGNENSVGIDVTFSNAAALPPAVGIVTPAGGYIDGLYTVAASAVDGTGIKGVTLELRRVADNGLAFSAPLGFAAESGLWQAVLDTGAFADGAYNLTVTAVNTGGVSGSATVEVRIDNHAPELAVLSPTEGAYLAGSFVLSATASDTFPTAVEYRVDGGPWVPIANPLDTRLIADGHHAVAVRATDPSGKATLVDVDIVVDNAPPSGALASLAPGQVLRGTHTFRVFAWDSVGVRAVTLALAGLTVDMAFNPQSGYWEYTMDTAVLADGSYTAQPTVIDASGKATTAPAVAFQVRNQPEPPSPVQLFVEALPVAYLGFLVIAFGTVVAMLRNRGRPRGGEREPRGGEPQPAVPLEPQPPSPPTPPTPPPPGGA